jgi:hypothetical protein
MAPAHGPLAVGSVVPMLANRGEVADALREAEDLAGMHRALDAIGILTAANRLQPDPEVERRLVELRHEAFQELTFDGLRNEPAPQVPVSEPDPDEGLPVMAAADMRADSVRQGIMRHGAVHVRGVLSPDDVATMTDGIDRAIAAHDAHMEGGKPLEETNPWWYRFQPGRGYTVGGTRHWVRTSGGVWTLDSPRNLFNLLEIFERSGIRSLVADYLGERPALSLNKSTLRRVPLDAGGEWHQDGAFMGQGIDTLNVWVALTDCGVDAPGLEVVPKRFDHIVETGTLGTWFEWAVAPNKVEEERGAIPTVRPVFEAGDVMVFDEMFLHRTYITEAMQQERYAIETWFFAPSTYPDDQIPVVW